MTVTVEQGAYAASSPQLNPDRLETQELRIASAMTGGVSLAIWMGGVARELNLLSIASGWRRKLAADALLPSAGPRHSPDDNVALQYLRLLDLLDVVIDVDVLSGTSAGGINAALLGFSRSRSLDLGPLRSMWIDIGSMLNLLRDPTEKDPPSLMYGDRVMFSKLNAELENFPPAHPLPSIMGTAANGAQATEAPLAASEQVAVDDLPLTKVFITTTFLTGETSRFTDSYGTVVQDTDHHGLFTFSGEDLELPANVAAIALAARSSASFPAAFEPSFLPFDKATAADTTTPARPAMQNFANMTRPHWVADGGLLANRPIRPLLETIFDRPADRPVRRVLLYVVPSAGPTPSATTAPVQDDVSRPLGLSTAMAKDLSAVLAQSITSDLRAIRDHNSNIDALSDMRLQIARFGTRFNDRLLTDDLLADYCERQGNSLVKPVVDALMQLISSLPPAAPPSGSADTLPTNWLTLLTPPNNVEKDCRTSALKAATAGWHTIPETYEQLAAFGRPAYDSMKATVITVLRSASALADTKNDRTLLNELKSDVHSAFSGIVPRPSVRTVVESAYKLTRAKGGSPADCAAAAAADYASGLAMPFPSTAQSLQQAWETIARAIDQKRDPLSSLLPSPTPSLGEVASGSVIGRRREAAAVLGTYLKYLFPGDEGTRWQPLEIAKRLFDLSAVQRAMAPLTSEVEQSVEFVQISADTRCVLDPRYRTAASKLTGMQLHHFGAFYKPSWRANDWMWGRLDGAGWLIHLLLDPARILAVAQRSPSPTGARTDWFYRELLRIAGAEPSGQDVSSPDSTAAQRVDEAAIKQELEYLDDPTRPVPSSLPLTALWMAQATQEWIAATELPILATEIKTGVDKGQSRWVGDEQSWVTDTLQAAQLASPTGTYEPARVAALAALFAANPVPKQTFRSEVGQPLLTQTATKAVATATNALTAASGNPGALKPFLSALRTVTLTGYRATLVTRGSPRRLIQLGLALMVVGAFLATRNTVLFGTSGLVVLLLGAYSFALGVWGRGMRHVAAVGSFLLLLVMVLPALPAPRRGLFGTSNTDTGLVGRHVASWIAWLGNTWWHVLAVMGALLICGTLVWVLAKRANRQGNNEPEADRLTQRWTILYLGSAALSIAAAVLVVLSDGSTVSRSLIGVAAVLLAAIAWYGFVQLGRRRWEDPGSSIDHEN